MPRFSTKCSVTSIALIMEAFLTAHPCVSTPWTFSLPTLAIYPAIFTSVFEITGCNTFKNSSLYIHLLNDLKLLFHLSKMKKWASKLILPSFLSVLQTSCACKPFFPFCLHMPFEFLKHIFPFANVVSILLIPRSLHACAHSAFFKLVDPGGHFIPAFAKMYLVLADEMMAKMNKK